MSLCTYVDMLKEVEVGMIETFRPELLGKGRRRVFVEEASTYFLASKGEVGTMEINSVLMSTDSQDWMKFWYLCERINQAHGGKPMRLNSPAMVVGPSEQIGSKGTRDVWPFTLSPLLTSLETMTDASTRIVPVRDGENRMSLLAVRVGRYGNIKARLGPIMHIEKSPLWTLSTYLSEKKSDVCWKRKRSYMKYVVANWDTSKEGRVSPWEGWMHEEKKREIATASLLGLCEGLCDAEAWYVDKHTGKMYGLQSDDIETDAHRGWERWLKKRVECVDVSLPDPVFCLDNLSAALQQEEFNNQVHREMFGMNTMEEIWEIHEMGSVLAACGKSYKMKPIEPGSDVFHLFRNLVCDYLAAVFYGDDYDTDCLTALLMRIKVLAMSGTLGWTIIVSEKSVLSRAEQLYSFKKEELEPGREIPIKTGTFPRGGC
jgi:hypothetical protein